MAFDSQTNKQVASVSKTVLLVDDDFDVREVTRFILNEHGFVVYEAEDGIEAMDLCRQLGGNLDLVIADLVMPKMGGIELFRQLATLYPKIQIILFSGIIGADALDDTFMHIRDSVLFIQKPFTMELLLQVIQKALAGK